MAACDFNQEDMDLYYELRQTIRTAGGFSSEMKEIKQAAAALGRKGGASKSAAKGKAARENGKKGGRPRDNKSPRCHRDGTVSYWSVYRQSFVSHAAWISDEDLAAMNTDNRGRVIAHMQTARKG